MKTIHIKGDARSYIWRPDCDELRTYEVQLDVQDRVTHSNIVADAASQITADSAVIVYFSFLYDMIRRAKDITVPSKEGLLKVEKCLDCSQLIEQTVEADSKLKTLYPNLRIIWTMPSKLDFLKFNKQFVEYYSQDSLSEREVRGCVESSTVFEDHISQMKQGFSTSHPDIEILDLEMLLSKLSCTSPSNGEENIPLTDVFLEDTVPESVYYQSLKAELLKYIIGEEDITHFSGEEVTSIFVPETLGASKDVLSKNSEGVGGEVNNKVTSREDAVADEVVYLDDDDILAQLLNHDFDVDCADYSESKVDSDVCDENSITENVKKDVKQKSDTIPEKACLLKPCHDPLNMKSQSDAQEVIIINDDKTER